MLAKWMTIVVLIVLFPDDAVAKLDAFITDIDRWSCDQFPDVTLTLSTERAVQDFPAFFGSVSHTLDSAHVKKLEMSGLSDKHNTRFYNS